MAKIDITKTELVWPGKYNDDGTLKEVPKVSLPFQVIEAVNESRATREAEKTVQESLFETYKGTEGDTFEDGWKNKLIWGDNLLVMGSLLEKFAGKIDLIYIDPPFATGADFSFTTEIGESGDEITKEQSIIEEKAYRDTWGRGIDSYLSMIFDRLILMRELLAPSGVVYVHCDSRVNYLMRAMLDEVFGKENLRNEIVWCYRGGGTPEKDFAAKHDTILRYSKGPEYYFDVDPVRIPYSEASIERLKNKANVFRGDKVYRDYEPNELGKHPEDWWTIQPIMPSEKQERSVCYYPTQKPVELLQRIIDSSAPPNGLVLDAFCGSGTTLVVAEGLRVVRGEKGEKSLGLAERRCRWIGCDLGRFAVNTARKRLLEIENCRPFEVLNLGKYERQYWQGVTFAGAKDKPINEHALYEYLAFVLKLYGAQPVPGMSHIHGQKGKAMVHVGAVDAPVTIDEISAAVDECVRFKQNELHVLGWEWEMGLYDLMVEAAKKKGVKLLLLQIPREVMEQQAAVKGDVHFFELAYLEAEIKQSRKLTTQVTLKDFVIPNTDLIPEDVRSKVKKWSDYIDYWAVDWDFQNDTFIQGWVAYRTRKDRSLPLSSDVHIYQKPGRYRILVKVIDIFGNDTTQAFDAEVK
ncbi:MAG: site-specific DNA-methyltransferase [Caldiserica bacterium]|nr:site-specific DNA-methyltransferase [Caldisericota bacterium]